MELPVWLPRDEWMGYLEMRKLIRKPMTEYAKTLAIKRLEKLRSQGENVGAVLEQSIFKSWQGLFPVKDDCDTHLSAIEPSAERQWTYCMGCQRELTASAYKLCLKGRCPFELEPTKRAARFSHLQKLGVVQ